MMGPGITESLRLEKTAEINQANHQPIPTVPSSPRSKLENNRTGERGKPKCASALWAEPPSDTPGFSALLLVADVRSAGVH